MRYELKGKARTRPDIFRVVLGPCAQFYHVRPRSKNGISDITYVGTDMKCVYPHVETVKLREIRPLVDIIHILLASRAEMSYSTRALRAIRKHVVLGLAPSETYDISHARARAIYCSAREASWIG